MAEPGAEITQPRILVVDDSELMRENLVAFLGLAGAETDQASNAPEAVRRLAEVAYTGALIDGLGGECWDVVEAAHARGVIPVILSGSDSVITAATEAGIGAFNKSEFIKQGTKVVVASILAIMTGRGKDRPQA